VSHKLVMTLNKIYVEIPLYKDQVNFVELEQVLNLFLSQFYHLCSGDYNISPVIRLDEDWVN
jgi:hypothetical protein